MADITLGDSNSLVKYARRWRVRKTVRETVVLSLLLLLILVSSVQVAFADEEAVSEVEYPETVSPGEEFDIVNTIEYDLDEVTLFSEEIFLAEDVPEGEPVPITATPLSERVFNLYGKGTVKVTHTLEAPDYETILRLVKTLWFHNGETWIEVIPERVYLEIKVQEPVPQILGVPISYLLLGAGAVTVIVGLLYIRGFDILLNPVGVIIKILQYIFSRPKTADAPAAYPKWYNPHKHGGKPYRYWERSVTKARNEWKKLQARREKANQDLQAAGNHPYNTDYKITRGTVYEKRTTPRGWGWFRSSKTPQDVRKLRLKGKTIIDNALKKYQKINREMNDAYKQYNKLQKMKGSTDEVVKYYYSKFPKKK